MAFIVRHRFMSIRRLLLILLLSSSLLPAMAQDDSSSSGRQTPSPMRKKNSLALALAGGGMRGIAHIGVLKVLDKNGIRPNFICGSSAGAMIGALYAAGISPQVLERLALNGEFRGAFLPRPMALQELLYFPRYFALRLLLFKPAIGLYSGKSIEKFVKAHLPPGIQNFEQMEIPFAAISVNLNEGKILRIDKGNIATAVRASCTLPFMYRPVRMDEKFLVDGGTVANLPLETADSSGASVVVGVRLHSELGRLKKRQFDTNFEYANRVVSLLMKAIEQKSTSEADVLIEPEIQSMHMNSFAKEDIENAIAAGEKATIEALPAIQRKLDEFTVR